MEFTDMHFTEFGIFRFISNIYGFAKWSKDVLNNELTKEFVIETIELNCLKECENKTLAPLKP